MERFCWPISCHSRPEAHELGSFTRNSWHFLPILTPPPLKRPRLDFHQNESHGSGDSAFVVQFFPLRRVELIITFCKSIFCNSGFWFCFSRTMFFSCFVVYLFYLVIYRYAASTRGDGARRTWCSPQLQHNNQRKLVFIFFFPFPVERKMKREKLPEFIVSPNSWEYRNKTEMKNDDRSNSVSICPSRYSFLFSHLKSIWCVFV